MPRIVALGLSFAALAGAAFIWAHYQRYVRAVRVPKWPIGHQLGMLAVLAVAAAVALAVRPRFLAAPSIVAGGAALVFLFLSLASRLPKRTSRVAVGSPLPAFSARLPSGERVSSASWRGKRLLIKVFRGFW